MCPDQRAAFDPEGFIRDGRNFVKGTWFGVTHPAELGKALIDWKDLTDGHPGKAVGQWLPDIALALLTGGLGTAADGSTEAARDLSRVEKAAEAARAAEVATEAAQRGGRVVIGAMEDLTASGTIGRGERTLLDQLTPSLESVEANWARNERVLLKEMDRGVPIRDASVDPETGELLHIDERTRFINRERDLLRSHGWTYDRRTHLWSPP